MHQTWEGKGEKESIATGNKRDKELLPRPARAQCAITHNCFDPKRYLKLLIAHHNRSNSHDWSQVAPDKADIDTQYELKHTS